MSVSKARNHIMNLTVLIHEQPEFDGYLWDKGVGGTRELQNTIASAVDGIQQDLLFMAWEADSALRELEDIPEDNNG